MSLVNVVDAPNPLPILISVPHCGLEFPAPLKDQFQTDLTDSPDDTDWFVDQLYDFAPSMGFSMITASVSRWVIDLNRDPDSKPLYSDGRIITGLCPVTNFLGEPLYKDRRQIVGNAEVELRFRQYYRPYHEKIEALLHSLHSRFGKVLLWDCHSIRQFVPTIRKEKFPDLILGSADETSASGELIEVAMKELGSGSYTLSHNHPFKGGYITRTYGQPFRNQHALQLEMSKVNYMDDGETRYDRRRAEKMRQLLMRTLENLAGTLMRK